MTTPAIDRFGRRRGAVLIGFLCAALGGPEVSAQQYAKLAPYASLRFAGSTPQVQHEGKWLDLVRIDDVAVVDLFAFCQREEGALAKKRFAEDLVEMLTRMGSAPASTVTLVLREA